MLEPVAATLAFVADAASGEPEGRSAILDVLSYDLLIDLTAGGDTFWSRTTLRFRCRSPGAIVFADLQAARLRRMVLNGADLTSRGLHRDGRLELPRLGDENILVVEAEFAYVPTGNGLSRAGDRYVYSNANRGGAARIFCCFDQPDLRAPITLSARAPAGWRCLANFPVAVRPAGGHAGGWRFDPTAPLAPYLFALCAWPDQQSLASVTTGQGQPMPMTIWAPAAAGQPRGADTLLDLAGRSLGYYRRALGSPYPYPKCDLAFVPGLRPLAFSPPGLCVLQDRLLEPAADRPVRYLACLMAHELAHAWFGGLVDMRHERDMWLQEALATYVSRTALEDIEPGSTPWAAETSESLPDDAYAKDAGLLRELEGLIGRPALLGGLSAVTARHRYGTVAVGDLTRAWSDTSGRDLSKWAAQRLVPAAEREA
jgi:aminopeptidase N